MQWMLDQTGRLASVSRDWCEFTGLVAAEAAEQAAVHPDDRAAVGRILDQAIATGSPFVTTYRMRKSDLSYTRIIEGASPAFSPIDGRLLGFLGTTLAIPHVDGDRTSADHVEVTSESPFDSKEILILDAIAAHLVNARTMARNIRDVPLMKTIDLVLLTLGRRLQEAIGSTDRTDAGADR